VAVLVVLITRVPDRTLGNETTFSSCLFLRVVVRRLSVFNALPFHTTTTEPHEGQVVASNEIRRFCAPVRVTVAPLALMVLTVPAH
jgi:hypothetical protein